MHALREFRGDGHVAVLTANGLSGLEALVMHSATWTFPAEIMRGSRAWSQEEWDAVVDDLRARGLMKPDELVLSDEGKAFRDGIEHQTDLLTMPAYTAIGEKGVERILELEGPIVEAVTAASGRLSPSAMKVAEDD
jgi:hypothetical protein